MTTGHKHRVLTLHVESRTHMALHRVLRKPRFWTTDIDRVDRSPYPYGRGGISADENTDRFYLSLLSILHRWTGLTLIVLEEE